MGRQDIHYITHLFRSFIGFPLSDASIRRGPMAPEVQGNINGFLSNVINNMDWTSQKKGGNKSQFTKSHCIVAMGQNPGTLKKKSLANGCSSL